MLFSVAFPILLCSCHNCHPNSRFTIQSLFLHHRREYKETPALAFCSVSPLLFFHPPSLPPSPPNSTNSEGEEDMPKWCTSDTATLLLAVLLDDFISFCTFLTSHPLHLAYLLFFFPYLVQLLSFLSPLLLSTFLLLLVILTVSPYLDEAPPAPPEFLGKTCCIVLNILKDRLHGNGRINLFEQFVLMILLPIDDASPSSREGAVQAQLGELFKDNSPDHEAKERECLASKAGRGESDLDTVSADTSTIDGEHIVPTSGAGSQCVATEAEVINGAEEHAKGMLIIQEALSSDRNVEHPTRSMSDIKMHTTSETIESFQRHGSMRKEKEWKRTLACKLYEERMAYKLCKEPTIAEGGEEMDLLWEAYEANATETDARKKEKKKAKRIELKEEEEEEEEEEEDEEATLGQLCCLRALRLSAGKMNLGVGKRNLMKISKVLKGMRMFTRSSSQK